MADRVRYSSGTPWEELFGYCRAVRVGDIVHVSGTAPAGPDGATVSPGDAYAQTRFVIEKIGWALREVGACLEDVVRVRMYTTDISKYQEIARAHREGFGEVNPAATIVAVAALVSPDMLIEMEAEAICDEVGLAG